MSQNKMNIERLTLTPEGYIAGKEYIGKFTPVQTAFMERDKGHPLVIRGNVDLGHWQPQSDGLIPEFDNIYVVGNFVSSKYITVYPAMIFNGELDLSRCGPGFVTADIEIPKFIPRLNFTRRSLGNLSVLFKKLLGSVCEEIIVDKSLIKPTELEKDPEKLMELREFRIRYPRIKVYDQTRQYEISDVLKKFIFQNIQNVVPVQKDDSGSEEVPKVLDKIIGEHIDIRDIMDKCRHDDEFNEFNLDDATLERLVRFVLSNGKGLQKETMVRADGVSVVCVSASAWPEIRKNMLSLLNAKKSEKENPKDVVVQKPVENKEVMSKKTGNEIKPIVIKKYISDSVLKQVRKSSGPGQLMAVLNAIEEINLDPLADVSCCGPVKITKNGSVTVSATIKKEEGCALVQSCDGNLIRDNKRLVWTIGDGPEGLVIVCQKFFDQHTNTTRRFKPYDNCVKNSVKRRTFSERDLQGYCCVADLLNMERQSNAFLQNVASEFVNKK